MGHAVAAKQAKSIMEKLLDIFKRNFQTPLVILVIFLIWQFAVMLFNVREFILPSPLATLEHIFVPQPDANYNWTVHLGTTIYEVLLSFAITSFVGIVIAIIMTWSKLMNDLLLPVFVFINSLPTIAIAPIITLWFGYGLSSLYFCRVENLLHFVRGRRHCG
jgi:ABC-type nitrate/sulfonate/bicarbonate transport system permease component